MSTIEEVLLDVDDLEIIARCIRSAMKDGNLAVAAALARFARKVSDDIERRTEELKGS